MQLHALVPQCNLPAMMKCNANTNQTSMKLTLLLRLCKPSFWLWGGGKAGH